MARRHLPEDLVTEILTRLPVKSLIRFKCVSKTWYVLTQNPRFIAMHLNRTNLSDRSDRLLIKLYDRIPKTNRFYSTSDQTLDQPPLTLNLHHLEEQFDFDFSVLGPCNGIFCLYKTFGHDFVAIDQFVPIVLLNPATRQFTSFSTSCLELPPTLDGEEESSPTIARHIGFGFDHKTNDYKVVKILCFSIESGYSNRAEVYSISKNSWRSIDNVVVPSFTPCLSCNYPCNATTNSNGVFHWLANDHKYQQVIVSFDFGDEVFRATPLIPELTKNQNIKIVSLRGLVAVIDFDDSFALWVMKEYGVKESWTCELSIIQPEPFAFSFVLGLWKNGEFLLDCDGEEVWLYDHSNNKTKDLQFAVPGYNREAIFYKESLVSVCGGN